MRFLLILLLIFLSQHANAQNHVGNLNGSPMVDAKGMFGYSIPIDLIKAPNQSKPNLHLAYHSGMASFNLTSGWYFTTSSISVCHPEDKSDALDYGNIYCHNGEELVFNSSTNYYQKKITDHNRYLKTTRGFILQKKNGEKEFYGLVQGNDPSEARTWYLTKKEDLRSNFIEYEYLNDADSKVQLKSISYGGNLAANLPHQYKVEINYSKIGNLLTKYSHGQQITEQHIPNAIRIINFGKVLFSYNIAWNESDSGYFLESISKCASNGECLAPLNIKYQTFDKSSFNEKPVGSQFTLADNRWDSSTHIRLPIDLNSDGSLDLLGIGPRKLHISYGNKGKFSTRVEINHSALNYWNRKLPIQLGDVNLDGFIDVLAFTPNGFEYINGTDDGFNSGSTSYSFFEGILRSDALRELDDINLDGYPDIIALQKDGVYVSYYSPQSNRFDQPILFSSAFSYQSRQPNWPIYYIDVNGDGVKDFLGLQKDGVKVSLRESNGFIQPETWSTDRLLSPIVSDDIHIGLSDYNMDGYNDIYVINQRGLHISFNTGVSYTDPVLVNRNLNSTKYPKSRTIVVSKDIDRDGQIDFIATNGSKISVLFGTLIRDISDTIVDFTTSYRGFDVSKHLFYLGDVENNAKDDLVIFHDRSMYRYEFDSTSSKISEVVDSFENKLIVNWGITDNLKTKIAAPSNDEFVIPFYYNFDVVKSLQTSGSSNYSEKVTYDLLEPLYHLKNGKFLGFKERSEKTDTKNIRSKTEFKLLTQVNRLVEDNSQLISRWQGREIVLSKTKIEWNVRKSWLSYEILQTKKTEDNWDNNSRHVSTSTEEFRFDSYMNQTNKTSTKKDQFGTYSVSTENKFKSDTNSWILGQLINSKVTHIRNGKREAKEISFSYNAKNLLIEEDVFPNRNIGTVNVTKYNSLGLPIERTVKYKNASGIFKSETKEFLQYDRSGFLVSATNDLSHKLTFEYNKYWNRKNKVIDANQVTESTYFNHWGEADKVIALNLTTTSTLEWCMLRCPSNALYYQSVKKDDKPEQRVYFDSQGREVRKSSQGFDGRWINVDTTYNRAGLRHKKSLPYFDGSFPIHQVNEYDELNRLIKVIEANQAPSIISYDGFKRITKDPEGRVKSQTLNVLGEKIKIEMEDGSTITNTYTSLGKLEQTVDTMGDITRFKYDELGREVESWNKVSGTIKKYYNGMNKVYRAEYQDGRVLAHKYDTLGRNITTEMTKGSEKEVIRTTWDSAPNGIGRVFQMSKGSNSEQYVYDRFSRIDSVTHSIDGNLYSYQNFYNRFSKPDRIIYPSGYEVKYLYNNLGFLKGIEEATTRKQLLSITSTNSPGKITEYQYGNGVSTVKRYNQATERLMNIMASNSSQRVFDVEYGYDLVGNVVKRHKKHTFELEEYSFDERYQLTHSRINNSSETVEYDSFGNILSVNNDSYSSNYTYGNRCSPRLDSPYQLCSLVKRSKSDRSEKVYHYEYDKMGKILSDGDRNYTYGLFDKLTRAESQSDLVSFEYGPRQQRVKRVESSSQGTSKIIYIGKKYEEIIHANKTVKRHYITDNIQVDIDNTETKRRYLHKDKLGSVLSVTDDNGNSVLQQKFDLWGLRKEDSNLFSDMALTDPVTLKGYTGHEMVDSLTLIHMNGRVYDPISRRFLSPDPFVQDPTEAVSYNRYTYAWNNPVSGADATGYIFGNVVKGVSKALDRAGSWASDHNNQKQLLVLAVNAAAIALMPASMPMVYSYMYSGAVGYAGTYYLTNGNHQAAMRSAATAMVFKGVGDAFNSSDMATKTALEEAQRGGSSAAIAQAQADRISFVIDKSITHGLVGGISAQAGGGNFMDGFLSAGLSQAASGAGLYEALGANLNAETGVSGMAWNAVVAASIGGTISELSGGDFSTGATMAAFGRLFNDAQESHRNRNRLGVSGQIGWYSYKGIVDFTFKEEGYYGIMAMKNGAPYIELGKYQTTGAGIMTDAGGGTGVNGTVTFNVASGSDLGGSSSAMSVSGDVPIASLEVGTGIGNMSTKSNTVGVNLFMGISGTVSPASISYDESETEVTPLFKYGFGGRE